MTCAQLGAARFIIATNIAILFLVETFSLLYNEMER